MSQRPASSMSDFERAEAPSAVNSNIFERAEAPIAANSIAFAHSETPSAVDSRVLSVQKHQVQ